LWQPVSLADEAFRLILALKDVMATLESEFALRKD
jgi:hypothetical protein